METIADIRKALRGVASPEKAEILSRFFKTGRGEYAEGDRFLGVSVPQTRAIARQYKNLALEIVLKILHSPFHEERLLALLILVEQYRTGTKQEKEKIYRVYLEHISAINNWDLVDLSAQHIVGAHLEGKSPALLFRLAKSEVVWERRIAMIATFYAIYQGNPDPALAVAEKLVYDSHDLIHKAVGWMLREVGKRCSIEREKEFLERYAATMPRTALRYAIERMSAEDKKYFLEKKYHA